METSSGEVDAKQDGTNSLSEDFRRIFDSEFGYVCRGLRRLGVRDSDMKDVAQELFMTLLGQLDRYDRQRPLRPWLFSFAVRFAANYRRLARNQGHHGDQDGRPTPSQHADLEARDLVLRALAGLDFDRRVAVVMHDMEGFEAPEIARELGVPLNTVYSRIRLGRADLRTKVTELQGKGAPS